MATELRFRVVSGDRSPPMIEEVMGGGERGSVARWRWRRLNHGRRAGSGQGRRGQRKSSRREGEWVDGEEDGRAKIRTGARRGHM
jgi:hypothetical protein